MSHDILKGFTPVATILLIASVPAFAKHARTVKLAAPADFGGVRLAAGDYELKGVSHRSEANIMLMQRKKVVAVAQGQWVQRAKAYDTDEVTYGMGTGGSPIIREIHLAGTNRVLVLQQPMASSLVTSSPDGKRIQQIGFVGKPTKKRQTAPDFTAEDPWPPCRWKRPIMPQAACRTRSIDWTTPSPASSAPHRDLSR